MRAEWILLFIILPVAKTCTEKIHSFEFGSVFRQKVNIKTSSTENRELRDIIQWTENYIEKRSPWSCPWLWKEQKENADVLDLSKVNLIYTPNDVEPLYYESTVHDRNGHEYGITNILIFGSMYRFILSWKKEGLQFVHNITVSVYPMNTYNIYSHTFYIQNVNSTLNSEAKFLLPMFSSDHLKETSTIRKLWDLDKYFDINFADIDSYTKQVSNQRYILEQNTQGCDKTVDNCEEKSFQYRYSKFQQDQVKVMSYNTWNMNAFDDLYGGYTERMYRLKQTILNANPDIIGLQEVRYEEEKGESLGPNQMLTLADWLPDYQFVFQPAQLQPNSLYDGRTEEGVAIMSKYPIISHDYHLLFINRSNSADSHQRIILHAEIILPIVGQVHVLNTHLSLSHEAREQSVVQICRYVSKLQGPVILLGDMNAEPNEPAMKYLNGQDILPGVVDRCNLRDIWLEKGDNPGFTYNSLNKDLHKRIDYMLYTGWSSCCKVETIKVLDDGKRGHEAASDHCPLMATFSFHPRETMSQS